MTKLSKYDAAVEEYLTRLQFKNLSVNTLRNYSRTLRLFRESLVQNAEPDAEQNAEQDVSYADVERWARTLLAAGRAPSTVNQYLTELGDFFDRATRRSFPRELRYPENPVSEDARPKVVKRPYAEILTDEQVKALYRNEAPHRKFSALWPRNYAMMMLFINEKIRNAELLDLRLSDVDFLHHELTVENGKGRKYRVIDLTLLSETALRLYLESGIRPVDISKNDFLFGTTAAHEKAAGKTDGAEKWHRGTGVWASGVIERTVKAVTGVSGVRSHDLRHVGSRVCLNAGESLEQLQGELGHASKTTTEIYSGRLQQRRRRESAQSVLAARDAATRENQEKLTALKAGRKNERPA